MGYFDDETDGGTPSTAKREDIMEQTRSAEGRRTSAAEGRDLTDDRQGENTLRYGDRKQEHLFHQFVENTTLHGVKYVTNPDHSKPRRLIWTILFVIMVLVVSYTISSHLSTYFAYATKTAIAFKTPGQTGFPTVILCNCNRFRISGINDSQWAALLPMMGITFDNRDLQDFLFNVTHEQQRRIREADFRQLGMDLSHEFETMLLDCRWGGTQRCSAANFTQFWTDFGVCYAFNQKDPTERGEGLMADDTGTSSGLWVRLNVEQSEHVSGNPHGSCFKVAVQPRGEVYFVRDVGRTVAPGYHSIIGLRKQVRRSMEYPYDSNCRKDGLKFFDVYSIGACRMECLTNITMEQCGCIAPFMPESSGFPYCNLMKMITCVPHIGSLHCKCHTPCSEVIFEERVSFARAPSVDANEEVQLLFNWSKEEVSENIVEVSIYFEDLREQWIVQEEAYDVFDLMSSIGGALGLCLGGSIITIFEFADFVFTKQALHCRLFRRKLRNVGRISQRDLPV